MTTQAEDEQRLAELADDLGQAATVAIGPWVLRAVQARLTPDQFQENWSAIGLAAAEAQTDVGSRLAALLNTDIDEQATNPLAVLRSVVPYAAGILASVGLGPADRDADARRLHPDDPYDLTPGAFADFGPDVRDAGLYWGAGKAHVHLRRRREAGQR